MAIETQTEPPPSPMAAGLQTAVLIVNPIAGDAEPNTVKAEEIVEHLAQRGLDVRLEFTGENRTAADLAQRAADARVPLVIIGGGDGTIGEAAKVLVHSETTLGIVPIGTFNNISRSLRIPTGLHEACDVIAHGHVRSIDVGLANGRHLFFEAAGVGLDAALFPIGEAIKGGRWTRIFQAALLTLQSRDQPIEIELDRPVREALPAAELEKRRRSGNRNRSRLEQRVLRRRALLTVIANGPYYGGGFTVAPAARVGDGRLTMSIYRDFSKWELVRHFVSISRGKYHYSPKVETLHVGRVRIRSPIHLPVHVDGQPIGHLPVEVETLPRALRVVVPDQETPRYEAGQDPNPPVALPAESKPSREKPHERAG
jgi:diacylglycerol kinase (ATP)